MKPAGPSNATPARDSARNRAQPAIARSRWAAIIISSKPIASCEFDRAAAYGMRLNIPAGTAVRFEPGEEKEVDRWSRSAGQAVSGAWAITRAKGESDELCHMSLKIPRRTYADLYGPTTGDRVRLADTELIIEVEKDFTRLRR